MFQSGMEEQYNQSLQQLKQFGGNRTMTRKLLLLLLLVLPTVGCFFNSTPDAGITHQVYVGEDGEEVRYTLSIPEGYSHKQAAPLVVALHYGGRVKPYYGHPILAGLVAPALEELKPIVISPDSTGGNWKTEANEAAVLGIMDEIIEKYNIDKSKVLVTGYSMGGSGTWYLASRHQDRFTAAIPIAGWPTKAETWKIPLYAIHSEIDRRVPIEPTRKYVNELQKQDCDVTLATVPDLTHQMTMKYAKPLQEAVPWLKQKWGIED